MLPHVRKITSRPHEGSPAVMAAPYADTLSNISPTLGQHRDLHPFADGSKGATQPRGPARCFVIVPPNI